jgi:cytoskeleton protein RodZ
MDTMTDTKPDGFGARLRQRREELGLSLDDVAASTRVRKTYLQALEDERLEVLPGGSYVVGFLRIYARQLGLPVEPLLAAISDADLYGEGEGPTSGGEVRRRLKKVKDTKRRSRRLVTILILLGLAIAAGLVIRLVIPTKESPPAPAAVQEAAPPLAAPVAPPVVPLPSAEPSATTTADQAENPVAEFAVIPPEGAVVRMLPAAAGMMKVALDNQEPREYQLQPEQSLNWKVSRSLAIELSVPGAVRLWVDQQELPVAGHAAFTLTRAPEPGARP